MTTTIQEYSLTNKQEALSLIKRAKELTVTNAAELLVADKAVSDIISTEKALDAAYKDHQVYKNYQDLCSQKGEMALSLKEAKEAAKAQMNKFKAEEKAREDAERERIQKEADEKARKEAEKAAIAAKKESDRLAKIERKAYEKRMAEHKKEQDRLDKIAAEEAAVAKEAGDKKLAKQIEEKAKRDKADAEARAAREKKDAADCAEKAKKDAADRAEYIRTHPAPVAVVEVKTEVPKTRSTESTRWSATIDDPEMKGIKGALEVVGKLLAKTADKEHQDAAELLRAVYFALSYAQYDQVKLNKQAIASHANLQVMGITFKPTTK